MSHQRLTMFINCVHNGEWKWFPYNNWHLVAGACGEPEEDEWRTLCGKILNGFCTSWIRPEQPLLYCRDCKLMQICEELGK